MECKPNTEKYLGVAKKGSLKNKWPRRANQKATKRIGSSY